MKPLFGLETEYGLAARVEGWGADAFGSEWGNELSACDLVDAVRATLPSLPDGSACGAFLSNGSRVYVDSGHPELATPEVSTPWDLVRYTLAGQRILERAAVRAWGAGRHVNALLFKSNVDYLSRKSWGCHESLQCEPRTFAVPELLIPHLVSRVVFAGAGGFDAFSPGLSFVLSPRALFLTRSVSMSSTDDRHRGIVHAKNEPLGPGSTRRLHLICGESLCSERALWLKTAATVLVVAMIDEGLDPRGPIELADPVAALHAIVRDPSCRAEVALTDGSKTTALDIQRQYLRAAEAHVDAAWMPEWAHAACVEWRAMLDQLEGAPGSVATTLDWAIKRALFERVLARHGFDWTLAARWTAALTEAMSELAQVHPSPALKDPDRLLDSVIQAFPPTGQVWGILNAHGLDPGDLEKFLRARRALFECDLRYAQLGGDGLFEALDRAGVLTHHVAGVGDVERAVTHPPTKGRAHVRGEAIRRLAKDDRGFVCDWTCISSGAADTYLDLLDPFVQEERWRPISESPGPAGDPGRAALGFAIDWRSYELRAGALDDYLAGRYEAAESALTVLLAHGFDPPSTNCHLARVALMRERMEQAREHVAQAWDARDWAPAYVVARTVWLQLLLAIVGHADPQPWIHTLKELALDRSEMQAWSMEPLLDRLRFRLPYQNFETMSALWRVVSGEDDRSELDRHAWWTAA
jgi:hypothetical protein